MNLGDLVLQNFFGIVATVIAGLILGFARSIRASTRRTEVHAAETAQKVSHLDTISLTSHDGALEQWQHDMATRIEGLAEGKSDTLAWQATFDRTLATTIRRVAALEQFALDLDAYAHGRAGTPTYTTPVLTTEGASDGD